MNQIIIKIIYDNCRVKENLQEGWDFSCLQAFFYKIGTRLLRALPVKYTIELLGK